MDASEPQQRAESTPPAATDSATIDGDFEHDDSVVREDARPRASSGLQLDSIGPPIERQPVVGAAVIEAQTEREIAGFGPVPDTFLGPFRYWWTVHNRLKSLKSALNSARKDAESNHDEALRAKADFGRRLHQSAHAPEVLHPLMDAALLAAGEQKGMERKRVNRSVEHNHQIQALEAAVEVIEQKIAPTRAERQKLLEENQAHQKEKRGVETQKKRAVIDLGNMETRIRDRTEKLSSPKTPPSERAAIALEIKQFESRCRLLMEQVSDFDAALETIAIPIQACQNDLDHVSTLLAPEEEKILSLKKQIQDIENQFLFEDRNAQTELAEYDLKVARAWAAVAEYVINHHLDIDEHLKSTRQSVSTSIATADEASRQVELLEGALSCYDKATVKRAQKQLVIAVLVLAVVVVVLVLML